jgi:WD40 repeat protein
LSKRENLNSRLPLTSSCLTLNLWASSVAATLVCAALTSSALASLNCRDVFADPSLLNQRVQLIQVGSLFAKIDRVTPDGSIQLSDGVDRFAVIGFKDGAPVMKKIVVPHSHDVSLGKSEILQAHELILRGQTMTWFAKDDIGNQTLHVYTDLSNSENFPESPSHAVRGLSVDGRFVVSSDGKSLRVFDTKERSVATEKRGLIGLLKSLSSSEVIGAQIKDDGTVISWYENGELRIYDKSLNFIAKENLKNENGEPLTKLDWIIESPDQKQVVIGAKGRVALYDLETKQISSLPADKTWASHVRGLRTQF